MRNLTKPGWIIAKGFLFVLLGTLAATFLLARSWSVGNAVLLAIVVWSFCRFYYFAFHVVEHYVDAEYKFTGLVSLFGYLIRRRKSL